MTAIEEMEDDAMAELMANRVQEDILNIPGDLEQLLIELKRIK